MDIFEELKNPSTEYRPVPFWSFNDKLEPEILREQIREMKEAGIGGYFMHARGGLRTEYMSEDWMNCIKACVEEGKKLGMNSWCYDENGWPSGFADGAVPALGDEYHIKWLELNAAGEVHVRSNPYYIDILNKDTVKAFINLTHEKYYRQFAEDFGDGILGFFTDEPQYSRNKIPWSHILPEEFRKKYGYDISEHLPALFIQCEGYEKIRYDFWSLVSQLYVTAFGQQIYNWCQEHNCMLTGHVMLEDSLLAQMGATAGAMPFYEYMHIPGMDWLGRQISSPIIPKQVGSVAAQLGKKQVLSETFALCGWNVSFEELKWIAEWQYVNGVNLMCQHLEGYTLRGLRKRDYPPSLFHQQSWWEEYRHFNDYFSRLGLLLSSGKSAAKVLLLHPIKSAWIAYDNTQNPTLAELDEDFKRSTELLTAMHIEHHYGDETLISKYGSVAGAAFVVGQCSYDAVVLPSMLSIDKKTLELLNTFIENGGKVLSIGRLPSLCEGVPCDDVTELCGKVLKSGSEKELHEVFCSMEIPSISVYDDAGQVGDISYSERILDNKKIFFLVNHSKKKIDATIDIFGLGKVRKLSLETVEYSEIEQHTDGSIVSMVLSFEPMQSHLLVFEAGETSGAIAISGENQVKTLKPGSKWNIEKMGLNSLTLDYCCYSIDNGPWEGPIHTINLMELLLSKRRPCDIALKFGFDMDTRLTDTEQLFLAVEDADTFEITVNGRHIEYGDSGYWKDYSFRKVDIKALVQNGRNEIILKKNFYQSQKVYDVLFGENVLETERNKLTYDTELESIYLVGDFGVKSLSGYTLAERDAMITSGPFVVTDKPVELVAGSFTEQGLCFFSDYITVSQTIQVSKDGGRYLLDIGKPYAPMSKLFINDVPAKTVLWAPYQIDVTDFIKDGDNKVSIELYASNRNLLGPHHNIAGESYSVGPATFTAHAGWSEAGSNFSGSMWTDTYCFVKFGI